MYEVQVKPLSYLIKKYGIPYYCKIDIEGHDLAAMASLLSIEERPLYISCETECLGDKEIISDLEALSTLDMLYALGYTKFKLIDQCTKRELYLDIPFYGTRGEISRISYSPKYNYCFEGSSSGYFGKNLESELLNPNWYDYESAKLLLLQHRRKYFEYAYRSMFGFWCDWHATREV